MRSAISLIFVLFLLQGCQSVALFRDGRLYASQLADSHQFKSERVTVNQFLLQTWSRGLDQTNQSVHVYIEGDGRAWLRKNKVSNDPTPKNPLALELAVQDKHAAVLYIARPCMYLTEKQLEQCSPKYWTSHRYAPEVINAIEEILVKRISQYQQVVLIGYSGGGSIAALLSERLRNKTQLITIAANLDHELWNKHHGTTPLKGSLNAVTVAKKLSEKPQRHLVGEKDEIVPLNVVNSFIGKLVNPVDSKLIIVPDFNHVCCWQNNWNRRLKKLLADFKH